jgi:hypothetical protein
VDRCIEAGFVEGEHLSVDGSFLPANASRLSRIPREQLPEAAHVKRTVREYLADLEQENPVEEPAPQQDQVSTTDPDSTYSTKGASTATGIITSYLSLRLGFINIYPNAKVRDRLPTWFGGLLQQIRRPSP